MALICDICGKTTGKGHDLYSGWCCTTCDKIRGPTKLIEKISLNIKEIKKINGLISKFGHETQDIDKEIKKIEKYLEQAKSDNHDYRRIRQKIIPWTQSISTTQTNLLRSKIVTELNQYDKQKAKDKNQLEKSHELEIGVMKKEWDKKEKQLIAKTETNIKKLQQARDKYKNERDKALTREKTANKRLVDLRNVRKDLRNKINRLNTQIDQLTKRSNNLERWWIANRAKVTELTEDKNNLIIQLKEKEAVFQKMIKLSGLSEEKIKEFE